MDPGTLALFEAVCAAGNLSAVACRLNIAQPSISRAMRDLEAAVGQPLFRRTGRGVEPTQAGLLLRQHADRMLRELDSLTADLAKLMPSDTGEVNVLLPRYVSDVIVPPLVRGFAERFPLAELHVFEEAAAAIPERLNTGTADLGLFYSTSIGAGLAAEVIAGEAMYLVALGSSIGQADGPISFRRACAMRLILSSRHTPFRRFVEQRAAATGQRLTVVRELEASQSALAFVRDGEGAAILPFSHVRNDLEGELVARPISDPALYRNVMLSFGKRPATSLSRRVSALLRSVVAAHGSALGWSISA